MGALSFLGKHDITRKRLDLTLVHSALDLKVAVFTPVCVPRITDDPVINSALSAVTNNNNFVISVVGIIRIITSRILINSRSNKNKYNVKWFKKK